MSEEERIALVGAVEELLRRYCMDADDEDAIDSEVLGRLIVPMMPDIIRGLSQ